MKVWLDILTPKQANLFGELQHRLNARGFKTVLTTREYREVNELLSLRGLKATQVGKHGGGDFREKLKESARRIKELAEVIEGQDPEVAISFSSPEAARVAFGLRIPHYCISDSPHAEAVCRLTLPLSQKLFTPWVIPLYAWKRYGLNPRDIIRYKALDPAVWLHNSRKNVTSVLESLRLDSGKPILVVRTPEEFASYLADRFSAASSIATEVIARILQVDGANIQIVALPRYDGQGERLRKRFGNRVTVPDHVIDAVALMQASSVFVGGGGTMTAEAALLGVPVISCYPGEPTFVEKFLINYGLVERMLDPGRIAQRAMAISKSPEFHEYYRKKSMRLGESMDDPLRLITQRIFKK